MLAHRQPVAEHNSRMTQPGSSRTDSASREELRQRCLALVRRWQPLSNGSWDRAAAMQLGEEVEQIASTSERLGLDRLNSDALDLAAYLSSFIDDALLPTPRDLQRLATMVNALGSDLSELSAAETATVRVLPTARVTGEIPVVATRPPPVAETRAPAPARDTAPPAPSAAPPAAVDAVNAVSKALTTEELTALNKKVDVDHEDASQAATEWLTSKGLA